MNANRNNILATVFAFALCACGDDIEYRTNPSPLQDCFVRYAFQGALSGDAAAPKFQGVSTETLFSLVSNSCQGSHILQSSTPLHFTKGEPPTGFANDVNGEMFVGSIWYTPAGIEFHSAGSKESDGCRIAADLSGMIAQGKISGTLVFHLSHPQSTANCRTLL